jgi:UDP-N-acetylglucosamine acyltransferase
MKKTRPRAKSRPRPRPTTTPRSRAKSTRVIHPTAVVARSAELGDDVIIAPYAVVGARVRIGRGTRVGSHALLEGNTTVGEDNRIFPFAVVGVSPQDLKFHGEESQLVIGDRNTIREFATLHLGTESGGMVTRVGSDNLLMAYTHVAHDCHLGNRIVMANGAQLGGHAVVQDFAVIGALVGVLQFVRIGESVMIGAGSMVSQDVPPFCNATGDRAVLHGLNLIGLRRRNFGDDTVTALKRAYRIAFRSGSKLKAAVLQMRAALAGSAEVERLAGFLETCEKGVCRPPARERSDESGRG